MLNQKEQNALHYSHPSWALLPPFCSCPWDSSWCWCPLWHEWILQKSSQSWLASWATMWQTALIWGAALVAGTGNVIFVTFGAQQWSAVHISLSCHRPRALGFQFQWMAFSKEYSIPSHEGGTLYISSCEILLEFSHKWGSGCDWSFLHDNDLKWQKPTIISTSISSDIPAAIVDG